MSRHDSHLWSSFLARLHAADMIEDDIRDCNAAIQRVIIADLGFDASACAALVDMLRGRSAGGGSSSPSSRNRQRHFLGNGATTATATAFHGDAAHSLVSRLGAPRHSGSVEWLEIEAALSAQTSDALVEVRAVSNLAAASSASSSSAATSAMEREFRTARVECGCQPERLFRFCPKRHIEQVAGTCNIFDSVVMGAVSSSATTTTTTTDEIGTSRYGQVIGRTLVSSFTSPDLARFTDTCVVVGVDALIVRPVTMTEPQFREWCASMADSADAHAALVAHGATCVQLLLCASGADGSMTTTGGPARRSRPSAPHGSNHKGDDDYGDDDPSCFVVFDSRVAMVRTVASVHAVRDSSRWCAPAALAARGCVAHDNRKFEFWCVSQRRLLCGMCLYFSPDLHGDCVVIDEAAAVRDAAHGAHGFREFVLGKQRAIAATLDQLEALQGSFDDRCERVRDDIDDAFAELRRRIDMHEADVRSAFEVSASAKAESLAAACDKFRRHESDAVAYLRDVDEALAMQDPARLFGVVEAITSATAAEAAYRSGGGDDNDDGGGDEQQRLQTSQHHHHCLQQLLSIESGGDENARRRHALPAVLAQLDHAVTAVRGALRIDEGGATTV